MRKRPRPPLGDRLKRAAEQSGHTSDTLSEALTVGASTVRGWWVGRSEPSLDTLQRYAALTNVSAAYLVTGQEGSSDAGPAPLRKAQVVQVLDAAIGRFTAHPATIILTPPRLNEDLAQYEHQDRLRLAVATILDEVQATYGRPWAELTQEEREAVLSELADTLLTSDEQPGEAAQEDS